jgi:alanyl-tRNA synthetase
MTSEEIRKKFLDYFASRGHTVVASSSLLPTDPSVLITTAGMQQFKPYFTGELDAQKDFGSKSTASIQKSFRTSDIEEVGDNTHLTLFEMLGNFSFGAYWKKEAITFAYELFTHHLQLPISYVTIFKGSATVSKDEESRAIWHSLGVTDVREEGMEDVFWGPTGTSGPCGPTTEIYCKNLEGKDVEVWNIVFNQFFYPGSRDELLKGTPEKELKPLDIQGIDTGAGLERVVTIKQGVASVYDTDLFAGIMAGVRDLTGGKNPRVDRIIADHVRASTFLIADGIRPSNKDAGYILRRLVRRVLAHKVTSDIHGDVFGSIVPLVQQKFATIYPELNNPEILKVLHEEQGKFEKAVSSGLAELKKYETLDAAAAFSIASTYGLNFELMKEMAPEATQNISIHDYEREFKKHQELSRAGQEKKFGGHGLLLDTGELKAKDEVELVKVTRLHTATHLLQAALREVLGNEVRQAGSDITAERTRFDFTFPRKVTPEEIKKVEQVVNREIANDLPVTFHVMPKKEAEKTGALFFFKAKYGDPVKVYVMGHSIENCFSKEFCGGPHVGHTAEVGKFKIAKEEAVSAGVRRIRGVVD